MRSHLCWSAASLHAQSTCTAASHPGYYRCRKPGHRAMHHLAQQADATRHCAQTYQLPEGCQHWPHACHFIICMSSTCTCRTSGAMNCSHGIMSAITRMSDLWRTAQQSLDLSDPDAACRTHRSERPAWLKTSRGCSSFRIRSTAPTCIEGTSLPHWRTVWAESPFIQVPRRHWAAQASPLVCLNQSLPCARPEALPQVPGTLVWHPSGHRSGLC